eukprot:GHVH01004147.1.p1 GENE.GHVH01004147.1~~GHVH01004147.1.p1  ORF type:complete len:656 (+),score=72.00 GHVH01004147.1:1005-2972(+)
MAPRRRALGPKGIVKQRDEQRNRRPPSSQRNDPVALHKYKLWLLFFLSVILFAITQVLYNNESRSDAYSFDLATERLLPTSDLDMEVEAPSSPLKELDINEARRFNDHTVYSNSHQRAMHGPLATLFPTEDLPTIQLSLDREFPDFRDVQCLNAPFYDPVVVDSLPSASVVIIFADEPFETLMRSVHSVLNNSPPNLLKEIILVDDGSVSDYITEPSGLLERYVSNLPKVFLTRTATRSGIMRARTHGVLKTTSDIFIVLDSHIEVEPGWIEPLIHRVGEDPYSFVTPLIDSIDMPKNYSPIRGGIPCHLGVIWRLQDHAFEPQSGVSPTSRITSSPSEPSSSPVMAGGLFAASKQVFFAVGGYDLGMGSWGAENVELGFRLWMCGARIDCMPCSRVAHIFDRGQTYSGGLSTRQGQMDYNKNRLRTAAVWMDGYAGLPHQVLGRPSWKETGDVEAMFKLRKNLQCHSFQWFIDSVWPESNVDNLVDGIPYNGPLRPFSKPNWCVYGERASSILRGMTASVRQYSDLGASEASLELTTDSFQSCPWFFFMHKIGAIANGFDDETVLRSQSGGNLMFDWNREGKDPASVFSVEFIDRYDADSDIVKIHSPHEQKCISDAMQLETCSGDESQLWLWYKNDLIMDQTNHYQEWLSRSE